MKFERFGLNELSNKESVTTEGGKSVIGNPIIDQIWEWLKDCFR